MPRAALAAAILLLAILPLRSAPAADGQPDEETRLRDALRQAITHVRELEDQQAATQAKQSELQKANDALKAEVDDLTRKLGAGSSAKPESGKAVAELNARLSAQAGTIAQLGQTLEKWKAAYNEAATVARGKEADRAKLAADDANLTQQATACEAKNARLFAIGNELLGRLQKVDLGDVMGRLEPFVGTKRVELQNLAQDYQDRLLDQKVSTP